MARLKDVIGRIRPVDPSFFKKAQERLDNLTKPRGSLGRLEEFAARVVAIREDLHPKLERKVIFTLAGDHGVVEEGVSAFPKEVTSQMVLNFIRGGAAINVLSRHVGADVVVVDVGVDHNFGDHLEGLVKRKVVRGTRNMRREPAMTRDEAVRSIEVGIGLAEEYAERGYHIFGTGEMGIGNTTPSSAIIAVFSGRPVEEVTGRGTGIDDLTYERKIQVIEEAIAVNRPDPEDPIDVLSKVGGAEIGGIAGIVLGAAARRIPVVIDGFISTAGALVAYRIEPKVKDYLFAAHRSAEKGHRVMLDYMGLEPFLDLSMRLGEGTGAALGIGLIEAGMRIYNEMATFDDASVSREMEKEALE